MTTRKTGSITDKLGSQGGTMKPATGVFTESLKSDIRKFIKRRNDAAATLRLLKYDTPYASEIRRLHAYLGRIEEIMRQELRVESGRL